MGIILPIHLQSFPGGASGKRPKLPTQETEEMQVQPLSQEDPLEEGMATHSNILAWRIPWTEEPGGQGSIGSQRVGHNASNLAAAASILQMRKLSLRG